jgi:hypothetical protein
VSSKKAEFGEKGYIHMQGNKVYIHVTYDGKTYFVYVKTIEDILNGVKKGASILGYR